MEFGAVTGSTRAKEQNGLNEDTFMIDKENGVYAVLDGMGGYQGTGHAASKAAEQAFRAYAPALRDAATRGAENLQQALRDTFIAANRDIITELQRQGYNKAATTAVLAVPFVENGVSYVAVASAGDSRGYVVSERGDVLPATRDFPDYTEDLEQKLRSIEHADELTSAEVSVAFRHRNVVSGGLGTAVNEVQAIPRVMIVEIPPGEFRIALMSDGVSDNLTEKEIIEIIKNTNMNDRDIADRLVAASRERIADAGHIRSKPDDVTALIADVETTTPAANLERIEGIIKRAESASKKVRETAMEIYVTGLKDYINYPKRFSEKFLEGMELDLQAMENGSKGSEFEEYFPGWTGAEIRELYKVVFGREMDR